MEDRASDRESEVNTKEAQPLPLIHEDGGVTCDLVCTAVWTGTRRAFIFIWPYCTVLLAACLASLGALCVSKGEVCGPLGYPLGGVAALLGCLVLGGGALVEVMARCSDTGHQALSQIEMESQDDLSVVEAMETFKDALEDIHQSPDADSESRLRKLRKLDSMRATPGDIVQLNHSSRKPGQMFGHRSQNQDPNSVYGT